MTLEPEDILIIKFLIVGVILTLVGIYTFYRLHLRSRDQAIPQAPAKSPGPEEKNSSSD